MLGISYMYWLKQPIKDTHEKQPSATAVMFGLWNELYVLTETAN